MWLWVRGGTIALGGLLAGIAIGFGVWGGREMDHRGFERRYSDGERVRVGSVVDGDTIRLEDGLMVRYRGCDTPEVFRFVRDPMPGAEEASARNRELVENAWVRLRFPPSGRPKVDVHGRLLADVYLDSGDAFPVNQRFPATVAETLVREGLAKVNSYEMGGDELRRLREAETGARAEKRGVWSDEGEDSRGHRNEAPLVASRHGKYVHRNDCEYAKRINPRNKMAFYALDVALSTGRGRCPRCLPGDSRHGEVGSRDTETGN